MYTRKKKRTGAAESVGAEKHTLYLASIHDGVTLSTRSLDVHPLSHASPPLRAPRGSWHSADRLPTCTLRLNKSCTSPLFTSLPSRVATTHTSSLKINRQTLDLLCNMSRSNLFTSYSLTYLIRGYTVKLGKGVRPQVWMDIRKQCVISNHR